MEQQKLKFGHMIMYQSSVQLRSHLLWIKYACDSDSAGRCAFGEGGCNVFLNS